MSTRSAYVLRNTLAGWTASNPVLASGEIALETDTGQFRFGDGATAFLTLPTTGGEPLETALGVIVPDESTTTAEWVDIIDESHTTGKPIFLKPGGEYTGNIVFSNKHCRIIGNGATYVVPATAGAGIVGVHDTGTAVTVTAVAQAIVGPTSSKPSPVATQVTSSFAVTGSALNQFKADDVWQVTSENRYEWDSSALGNIWKAAIVPILGVSFQFTPTGSGIAENDTVVGVTSGATGFVQGYAPDSGTSGAGKMILKSLTGTFTVGETFTVGGTNAGTINAAGLVLSKHPMSDTYTTSIKLRKMRADLEFYIKDLVFDTTADPDTIVGYANRPAALSLLGVVNPVIDVKFVNSWTRCISLATCWKPVVDLIVDRAANNATTSPTGEQAYGYGLELEGATEGCSFRGVGTALRHLVTTNVTAYSTFPTAMSSLLLIGTVKNNTFSGKAIDCWGPGWDNHIGAQNTRYENCENIVTVGSARYVSGISGFQNRSFNTTYKNCTSIGSVNGFKDWTADYPITSMSLTTYDNCYAEDHQYAGFIVENDAESEWHRYLFINCRTRGANLTSGTPYSSIGYKLAGIDVELINCRAERFSLAPFEFTTVDATYAPTYLIDNFTADYLESTSGSASGGRIGNSSGALQTLIFASPMKIRQRPTTTSMPASSVRVMNGSPVVNFAGEPITMNTTTAIPKYLTSAGTPVYGTTTGSGGGAGDALTTNPLSQFAATTSAQLRGVLSDETGTGAAVFATSPALVTPTGIVKGDVGLGSVDNTSDANKPVSTAQQTALDLKAPLASPAFTGTPTGITKTHVGLSNADNTSDVNKPVSTAQQTALDLKAEESVTEVFSANGTWTKPTGAKMVQIICVAGGAGGGSGRRGAVGTLRTGGAGGGGGALSSLTIPASALAATESVVVGAGGAGGPAVTANATNGSAGSAGALSSFSTFIQASGGGGGAGGDASGAAAAGAAGSGLFNAGAGGASSATGAAGASPSGSGGAGGGGGSGGGVTTGNSVSAGGAGGRTNSITSSGIGAAGGAGANGGNATAAPSAAGRPGHGGGGGGSSITGVGGNGGNGADFGGGGGGGGASLDGSNSGAGGTGGAGVVIVTTYF